MKKIISLRLVLGLVLFTANHAIAQSSPAPAAATPSPGLEVAAAPSAADMQTFIALLRSDLQTQKAAVIAENISFTEDEALNFWPMQREYQLAVTKLYDQRLALMREVLDKLDKLSDDEAGALAAKAFAWEHERTKLKEEWYAKFVKVIPAKKAVRFFQIENQVNAAIDLRLSAAMPLIH
jgi:hypothetical protein